MGKIIVLRKNVFIDVEQYFDAQEINYEQDGDIFSFLESEFVQKNNTIFYRMTYNGIELISPRLILKCELLNNNIVAKKAESHNFTEYTSSLNQAETMWGPFEFLTEDESAAFISRANESMKSNAGQQNISDKKTLEYDLESPYSQFKTSQEFVDYWSSMDLLKCYEEKDYEAKVNRSVHKYTKYDVNYKASELTLFIAKENEGFTFRSDDTIYLCTSLDYERAGNVLRVIKPFKIGTFKQYKNQKTKIVIKITQEELTGFLKNKQFEEGVLFILDKGFQSKQRREKEALEKLYQGRTVNKNMPLFFPEISNASLVPKKVDTSLLSSKFSALEEMQKKAVLGALQAEDIFLIQGPPGTGKTTVICEMISYLIKDHKKVLLSSQTHLAVDNVLQRIGDEKGVKALRIGREEKFELGTEKYSLDNCAIHIQSKIRQSLVQEMDFIESILNDTNITMDNVRLHEKVKNQMCRLKALNETSLKCTEDVKYGKERVKKYQIEIETTTTNLKMVDYVQKEKYTTIQYLNQRVKELSLNQESLIEKISLYEATLVNEEEAHNLMIYRQKLSEVRTERTQAQLVEDEIHSLEVGKKNFIDKLNSINEQRKAAYREATKNPSLKGDFEKYTRFYEEEDTAFSLHLNKIRSRKESLIKLQKSQEKVFEEMKKIEVRTKPVLNRISEALKKTSCNGFMTKVRLLQIVEESSMFRRQFDVSEEDFYLLLALEDIKKANLLQQRIKELETLLIAYQKKLVLLLLRMRLISEEVIGIVREESFRLYLSKYSLSLQVVNFDKEIERCIEYAKEYHHKMHLVTLHEKTNEFKIKWQKVLETPHQCFRDYYIRSANLICATCLGIASANESEFDRTTFDYVIIDEAARATSTELLVPLTRGGTMILVGDHEQINPEIEYSVLERLEKEEDKNRDELKELYNSALFGKLFRESPDGLKTFLNKQHRMHSGISKFVSQYFYDNKLEDGKDVYKKRHGLSKFKGDSLVFVGTPKGKEYEDIEENTSYRNEGEAKTILSILDYLDGELQVEKSVGIITPYQLQETYLKNSIRKNYSHLNVEVNTIDGFQGREMEIIILSLVRNNSQGRIGHLGAKSRLNVSLSRAQELLIIVGHRPFFAKTSRNNRIQSIIMDLEKGNKVYESADFGQ